MHVKCNYLMHVKRNYGLHVKRNCLMHVKSNCLGRLLPSFQVILNVTPLTYMSAEQCMRDATC